MQTASFYPRTCGRDGHPAFLKPPCRDDFTARPRGESVEVAKKVSMSAADATKLPADSEGMTSGREGAESADPSAARLEAGRHTGDLLRATGAFAAARERIRQLEAETRWLARRAGTAAAVFAALRQQTNRSIRIIRRSGMFDPGWYLRAYPEAEKAGMNPLAYYARTGWRAGHDPHPLFSTAWYLESNPDVRAGGIEPLLHYLRHGASEGRDPHPLFLGHWYLSNNPDVASTGMNPLVHYVTRGGAEGRDPHPLFKADWYLQRWPDVAALGMNPLAHYLLFGARHGRDPHPLCGTEWYEQAEHKNPLARSLKELREQAKRRSASRAPGGGDLFTQQEGHSQDPASYAPAAAVARSRGAAGQKPERSYLSQILLDEYGADCDKRVADYFAIIAPFQAGDQMDAAKRSDILRACTDRLKSLARRHADGRSVDASIVISAYNHIEYTIACVLSLLEHPTRHTYEIVIANDVSVDETRAFFEGIGGNVRVVTASINQGFTRNCNFAARHAIGRHLVLLNNDTFVLDGWLNALLEPFERMKNVGLVGSKLLAADGHLQEAGGIFWRDGSAWNFGRAQDPRLPEFNYVKDVDYVSGAAIAVPREIWQEVGGFDERYAPAYYEDADLAFTLRSKGLRTMYQPFSAVIHHEGVSHGTDTASGVKAFQVENLQKFLQKWKPVLAEDHFENAKNVFAARDRSARRAHVLVIDHYIPQFDKDAGSRAMFNYLKLFVENGLQVTFWPDTLFHDRYYAKVLQNMGIEVLYGQTPAHRFDHWIGENGKCFDYVFLSRPQMAEKYIRDVKRYSAAKILYFGHDLHFMRAQKEWDVLQTPKAKRELDHWRRIEPRIWATSDVVYYPGGDECEYVRAAVPGKIVRETPIYMYSERQLDAARKRLTHLENGPPQLLFVGGFRHGPNADGILWFCRHVLPVIEAAIPDLTTHIVGSFPPPEIEQLASPRVNVAGFISDAALNLYYRGSTIAIAPLRFGGGVKGKIIEALRHGLPVVTTAVGLQGIDGGDRFMTIADTPVEQAEAIIDLLRSPERRVALASQGLDFVAANYSWECAARILAADMPELALSLEMKATTPHPSSLMDASRRLQS
jgi:GT2 family glycosyltransferase